MVSVNASHICGFLVLAKNQCLRQASSFYLVWLVDVVPSKVQSL